MDIAEFLEKDIIAFVEATANHAGAAQQGKAAEPMLILTRDYEKEFFAAIEKKDFVAAKRIMEDLKKEFDDCPPGVDKQQIKALLVALYEKFKDEVEAEQIFTKMETQLDLPEAKEKTEMEKIEEKRRAEALEAPASAEARAFAKEIAKLEMEKKALQSKVEEKPIVIVLEQPKVAAKPIPVASKPMPRHDPKPAIKEVTAKIEEKVEKPALKAPEPPKQDFTGLISLLEAAEKAAKKGDVKTAIYNYKESKLHALKIKELPVGLIDMYRATYAAIKLAMLHAPAAQQPHASSADELDRQLLLQLEREKRKLEAMLHQNDIKGSVQQFKRMKLIAHQLHSQQRAKTSQEKLQRIKEIIQEVYQHSAHDDRKLVAVP